MGRALLRVSTSEPDPESLERSEGESVPRRYELTPLFWGAVNAIKIALLVTVVVLLGLLLGAQNNSVLDALKGIESAITPGGRCVQSREGIWDTFWEDKVIYNYGDFGALNELTAMEAGATSYDNRMPGLVPDLCAYRTKERCNTPSYWPYIRLFEQVLNTIKDKKDCLDRLECDPGTKQCEKPFKKKINDLAPAICGIVAEGSSDGPLLLCDFTECTAPGQVEAFNTFKTAVMDAFPYPCSWEDETVGSFLTARFPFGTSLAAIRTNDFSTQQANSNR